MPKIPCECGCGTLIAPISKMLRPARYAHGHNPDGIPTRYTPGRVLPAEIEARRVAASPRGETHPRWNGGEWPIWGGYIRRTLTAAEAATMPTALRHGRSWSIMRTHYVWNLAHPADPVQPGDEVHHVNRNRADDRLENLRRLTMPEHRALHAREAREARQQAA